MPRIHQASSRRYDKQRSRVTPPHVSLGDFRVALGMTIDEVIARAAEATGREPMTRGAVSAIENGHRGASNDVLRALEIAYELPEGAITTAYRPRAGRAIDQVAS